MSSEAHSKDTTERRRAAQVRHLNAAFDSWTSNGTSDPVDADRSILWIDDAHALVLRVLDHEIDIWLESHLLPVSTRHLH